MNPHLKHATIFMICALLALSGCKTETGRHTDGANKAERNPTLETSNAPQSELHVIGVYEGHAFQAHAHKACLDTCLDAAKDNATRTECRSETCPRPPHPSRTSMTIPVNVSRPGQSVTLVLGAYDPIQWQITADASTQVTSIALIGHGAAGANAELNGQSYAAALKFPEISSADDPYGSDFRYIADRLPERLGFVRISSFQGAYRAPPDGFTVDALIQRPEFEPDYLSQRVSKVSRRNPLRVEGAVGGQAGIFRLDGQLDKQTFVQNSPRSALTRNRGTAYVWSGKSINVIDTSTNRTQSTIKVPDRKGRGKFKCLVLDEKRNRLIMIFQAGAGDGEIVSVSLANQDWQIIGSTGRNKPNAMIYDRRTDTFIVSGTLFGDDVFIGQFDPVGHFVTLREIPATDLPGFTDLFDPENERAPNVYVLDQHKDKIALGTDGRDVFDSQKGLGPMKRIYEVDMTAGTARLTYHDRISFD